MTWPHLKFWHSGEWQVIEERLEDMKVLGKAYCPGKANLFAALKAIKMEDVRCAIIGQDPYPDPSLATGLAFSIPGSIHADNFPPSLVNLLKEYVNDLHDEAKYPYPTHGDLIKWCSNGVLLWNSVPTCEIYRPLSHDNWDEWKLLTEEIVKSLSSQGIIFCFLGGRAREFSKFVDTKRSDYIAVAHPSPLSVRNKKTRFPFVGSRIFTTINGLLVNNHGHKPIDWSL